MRNSKIKMFLNKQRVPHFYVVLPDGMKYHFTLVEDIFVWPFCYLLFWGQFQGMAVTFYEENH